MYASAISTAFKAAPLNKLSETIHMLMAFFLLLSFLILEIKVSFFPSAYTGVIYHP